ncbi:MAG: DUF1365 domain-containing protein [Rickettsiales bacterium]|nr:DUF1365 domain-containing protein [Rickettsiales bacterium]
MALERALLITKVSHARQRPKANRFSYSVFYLCFALEDMTKLANRVLSLSGFNLFSFREADYGPKGAMPLQAWVTQTLAEWGMTKADGRVVLLTLPRLLGYVFNPVSFYFCLDAQGALRAVISEVTNTFGDRHSYISFRDDHAPITQDDILLSHKMMHVSPFADVAGEYRFRFAYREDKIGVWIDHHDEEGLLISTSLTGKRETLTAGKLFKCFFRYPLLTLKVIFLIHYQALKLWLKGVRYRVRPAPPPTEISR